ncbi:MAG: cupin domain-containing protein [Alphaproteobacteria bacterium]|nr:cupin domain-containing protein [Alphaproteobacteria bacterium]
MSENPNPEPIVLQDMMDLAARADTLHWQPFRDGVELHQIYGTMGQPGPSACLLRFQPGAKVPRHRHTGYEHIIVLEGGQTDDRGHYTAGTALISPPGTDHAIVSEEGCIVLAIYQSPVAFD